MAKRTDWTKKEDVLKRVKKNGNALRLASKELADDDEVVFAAINLNSESLMFASDRLKDNKTLVLNAVTKNGYNLRHASDRLRDDYDVVLSSVQEDAIILVYASNRLRSDVNFCIECAVINPNTMQYFLGESKKIFGLYNNDPIAVQSYLISLQQQQKDNENLLIKLKEKTPDIPNLFKMNLYTAS
jgi:hypothetical protein